MKPLSVTYASAPSADLLIPTLEFNNEAAGAIRIAQSFNDTVYTGVKTKAPQSRGFSFPTHSSTNCMAARQPSATHTLAPSVCADSRVFHTTSASGSTCHDHSAAHRHCASSPWVLDPDCCRLTSTQRVASSGHSTESDSPRVAS